MWVICFFFIYRQDGDPCTLLKWVRVHSLLHYGRNRIINWYCRSTLSVCIASVMTEGMCMGHWWKDSESGKLKYLEESLSICQYETSLLSYQIIRTIRGVHSYTKLYLDVWDQRLLPTCRRVTASPSVCLTLKIEELCATYRVFLFPSWLISAGPTFQCSFIRLSKCYFHCVHLSNYRRRLLNLPDRRSRRQRWQGVGRNVGPALSGQAGTKEHPKPQYQSVQTHVSNRLGHVPTKLYGDNLHC